MLQYIPHLEAAGWSVSHSALLDDDYLGRLYNGRQTFTRTMDAYVTRLKVLLRTRQYSMLWIEKELLPWVPWIAERAFLPATSRIVTDYDDAIFHNYDMHRSGIVRRIFGQKIDAVMRHSNLVLAGNQYLAERATSAGARDVRIVPTVVDLDRYPIVATDRPDHATVGWMGTPSTWKQYMAPMLPVVEEAAARFQQRLMVVGASAIESRNGILDSLPWSEQTEAAMISRMGVGLMPLDDTPWARGKCGYKLIQYMASGIPVIASPVGVNSEIVEHGVNGFLAESTGEWKTALHTLLADPELRRKMGMAGRRKVESRYSLIAWAPRIAELLAGQVSGHGRR